MLDAELLFSEEKMLDAELLVSEEKAIALQKENIHMIVLKLLEVSDIFASNLESRTALMYFASQDSTPSTMIEILTQKIQANPQFIHLTDIHNKTALDYAKESNNHTMIDLLQSFPKEEKK